MVGLKIFCARNCSTACAAPCSARPPDAVIRAPLKIPARSTIKAVAHYDNSAKNPRNQAPDQEVIWGPQAINEMFIPFLEVSVDKDDLRFEGVDPR